MQIINRIKKSLPVLIGLLTLWLGLFFYATILNKSNQDVDQLIPKDANFVFKIKVKDFIKSATYSLIFNSKDQDLLDIFDLFIKKKRQGESFSDYGIDFTQDLTFFGKSYKSGEVYVTLLNLADEEKFDKNNIVKTPVNQHILRKENIGFVASYFGKDKLKAGELKRFLDKLEFTESKLELSKSKDFFTMDLKGFKINDEFIVKKGSISSQVNEGDMAISGSFATNNSNYEISKWTLNPRGLHVENSLISAAMQDSMQKYLNQLGLSLKRMDRISLNYYGIEIQETEKGVIFTPLFDLLLTFKEDFKFAEVFKDLTYLNEFGFEKEKNVIHAGKIDYFIDSIDQNTFFIGNHENQVVRRKSKTLFSVNGDLTNLTTIKGGGFFINSIIGMLPPFKASKNIFEKIETISIQAIPENKIVQVKGNITLKENQYLFNELLRFYLTLQGEL